MKELLLVAIAASSVLAASALAGGAPTPSDQTACHVYLTLYA